MPLALLALFITQIFRIYRYFGQKSSDTDVKQKKGSKSNKGGNTKKGGKKTN